MGRGQKFILTIGILMIITVTISVFFKDDIEYTVTTKKIEHLYSEINENDYFYEDHFEYVDNYEDVNLTSKTDIINSIYYIINSGETNAKRYCVKEYANCYNDINEIANNKELLSNLNSFVHPYNSFDNISFEFNDTVIDITIEHAYTDEDIKNINTIVNDIINNSLKSSMSTKDKIKIIHDYIIDNADYDTSYNPNNEYNKYKSNTAYGVLIQGYGICSGYSDAMAIFLDKLNIINYRISNDKHIWNLVFIDGKWLHLDVTWDDPISDDNITRDNYFLINTKTLKNLNDGDHYYNPAVFVEAS